jgi:hypothetical protein
MFENPNEIDEKVDIFAYGCLLYEMSELVPLFDTNNLNQNLDDKLNQSRLVEILFNKNVNYFKRYMF